MTESIKSAVFVGVALVIALVAWATRPSRPGMDKLPDVVNQPLFPEFTDPLAPASLEIVQYDEATAKVRPFKVAQINGRWSIPSHENYPTDAKDQLAEAASSLMNLTVLDLAPGEGASDHEQYGVVDPGAKDFKPGARGVGTRVVMRDKSEKELVSLVIGKEVTDIPSGRQREATDKRSMRYVRVIDQDPVYIVRVGSEKLSTKFGEWIEKDLLKLSTWDVKKFIISDYSVDIVAGRREPRAEMILERNDGEPKWKSLEDTAFDKAKGAFVPQTMAADEELNTKKLDDATSALGDLKIVDVARKPEGFSSNLRLKGQIKLDQTTASSLAKSGYYLVPADDNSVELLSTEGEIRVLMKDGVRYVLRFGRTTTAGSDNSDKKDAKDAKDAKDKTEASGGLNRYLFVMAEFDSSILEKPKLDPLPEAKPDAKPEAKPGETAKPAEAAKPADKKDEKAEADKKAADLKAERERVEKANKAKEDEYNKKIEDGKKRVKELNDRFADWYYVIADDVYQKIHLGRKDVIQKKEKKDEKKDDHADHDHAAKPDSVDEFKDLKKDLPAAKPGAVMPEAAKPEAAKPEAPKPEAPKPEAPKPEAPKPEAPKPEAPKPEAKVEAPKPEAPKPEGPKPEAKVEAPKPEVKPEAPKPEAPKVEAPKPEAPKADAPKPAEPKLEPTAPPASEKKPEEQPAKK